VATSEPIKFYGVKETLKVLQQIEPEMYKQLRKDIRSITAPAVSSIKSSVPSIAPLSGMVNAGRTGWSGVNVTTNITPGQRSRAIGSTTANLVAISSTGKNGQYGFNIVDMAGRGSGHGRRPKNQTREYSYKNGNRTHRIDGSGVKNPNHNYKYSTQGQALIANLSKQPSRYVYPAIENQLPAIIIQVGNSLQQAANAINRKLDII
jgi:hypothetical protein